MSSISFITPRVQLSSDAEWDDALISEHELTQDTICTQFVIPTAQPGKQKWFCLQSLLRDRQIIGEDTVSRVEAHCKLTGVNLYWVEFNDSRDVLTEVLDMVEEGYEDEDGLPVEANFSHVDNLIFSSPRDIWKSHGWNNVEEFFDEANIDKKRAIEGSYKLSTRNYKIWDLSGWTNESLKSLAMSVSVDTKDKGKMDKYKSNMLQGLIDEPEMFIDYSMNDPELLLKIVQEFTKGQRTLQIETLGLPERVAYTIETIPRTVGSVVAQTIQKVVDWKCYEKDPELIQYCLRIMGVLDSSHCFYEKALKCYTYCVKHIKNRADFNKHRFSPEVRFILNSAKFEYFAYSYASVKWLGSDTRTSNAFNALIHGGRPHNEKPKMYRGEYTCDADERSAYGKQLSKQVLPIGIPRSLCFTPNEKRITVGDFIDKYLPKCEPGRWQLVFSGTMPSKKIGTKGSVIQLKQDLITSKRTTQRDINRAILTENNDEDWNDDVLEELRKIPGDFGVFKLQIENGILNQRMLEVYMAAASEFEINALRDMTVVSGLMYYTEDKVTVDEWIDEVLADTGTYTTNDRGNPVENRTLKWFPFDLGKVIFQKTIKDRDYWKPRAKTLKKQVESFKDKDLECPPELEREWKEAAGKQEALKLFNNTGYGVLISPYFSISNVIVGNNITGGIRADTWMLKVAVGGRMTITDGTFYDPRYVLKLEEGGKKPSLTTISDPDALIAHRSVKVICLGGVDWEKEFETAWKNRKSTEAMVGAAKTQEFQNLEATELDRLTTIHVNNFWANYGLTMDSTIEHKNEHFAYRSASWGKADYGFLLIKPMKNDKTGEVSDYLFKVRGCKQYASESSLRMSPKFTLLYNILNGIDIFPPNMNYDQFSLCTPPKYRQVTNSKGYLDLKGVRPGDSIIQERIAKFNNDWCVEDFAQYDTRKRRTVRKDAICFEKFKEEGIAKIHRRMMEDKLR
jgi:hypothetical protein